MAESAAVEVMQLNGADEREGRIRKRVLVVAKGFDVSVPEGCTLREHVLRLESKLRDHFSSCGKIKSVCIPHPYYSSTIKRYAYIDILGEAAEEKALQLSGIEMDGHELDVTPPMLPKWSLGQVLKSAKKDRYCRSVTMVVKGYDTSPPRKSIKRALSKKFSSCGEVMKVDLSQVAGLSIYGEGAKEKALQLNGCKMGGCKLVVENAYRPETPIKPRLIPFGVPPFEECPSDPNWKEKYYYRSRLIKMGGCKLVVENAYRPETPIKPRLIPFGGPPFEECPSDPYWKEKYYYRSRLINVEKKIEED